MRKTLVSLLALAAVSGAIAGCGGSPLGPVLGLEREEGLKFASQASEPARVVELLSARASGDRAQLEYAVLRGASPHRRSLSIDFNGEPANPEAWSIKQTSFNGVRFAKGSLSGRDRDMIKQELAELKARLANPGEAAGEAPAAALGATRSVQTFGGALKAPSRRNRVEFHVSAEASRQALLDAVARAQRSFFVETFIWHDDVAGRELADALIARKRQLEAQGQPFEVKVLIDAIGLRFSGSPDGPIVKRMREAGIEVRLFAPYFLSGGRLAPITHHKLYIADGSRVITGGRNVGEEYLFDTYTAAKQLVKPSWHDLLFSVYGEETGRIRDEFFKNWERAGGQRSRALAPIEPVENGLAAIETVTTDPNARAYGLREAHERLIRSAEREIVAIYPYFSDDRLIRSLIEAKRRNPALALKIMLPGARQPDSQGFLFEVLNEESAAQLLAAGAEVRMYAGEPGTERFSHFKGLAIDNDTLSLGSANADVRTYQNNHELNTLIQDPATAADFRRQVIDQDWTVAKPLTSEQLQKSKLTRKVARKVLEIFDFLL